jgi:hypothetical protein
VRDFRTEIEQTVAASLRGIPQLEDFDVARIIRESQGAPPPAHPSGKAFVTRAAVVLAAVVVVVAVLVWLLLR